MTRAAFLIALVSGCTTAGTRPSSLEWVRVSDGRLSIVPWSFNYDHDEEGRLLEECRKSGAFADALMAQGFDLFRRRARE